VKSLIVRVMLPALCALALAGCIESAKPILTDSQPLLGQHLRLQFYSLRKGHAYDPEQAEYTWNGAHYAHAGGGMRDITAFSVHPFEGGDYIVQTAPSEPKRATEYALMHVLADGVFQVLPVDEDDVDKAVRAANCSGGDKFTCRVATRDQLLIFTRATAARHKKDGGIAILLPDETEHPARP
jgi:hypothetical protein